MSHWAAQQLAEFLAAISAYPDEPTAIAGALEWTAEALEAEVCAIVRNGEVIVSLGFPVGQVPAERLLAVAAAGEGVILVPSGVESRALVLALDGSLEGAHLLLARDDDAGFDREEVNLVRALARVLTLTLRTLRLLNRAREQERVNQKLIGDLSERQFLLERLARIQRSISHRANLEEVLDAIVGGARELLDDDVAMLRLVDADDTSQLVLTASSGLPAGTREALARTRIDPASWDLDGTNGELVVETPDPVLALAPRLAGRAPSSLSAPVHDGERIAGALTVVSFDPDRAYTSSEREALLAFAEHVRLAMTSARTSEDEARQRRNELEFGLARQILADLSPAPPSGHPDLDVHAESRSAYAIGGDFYDFDARAGGELACVLGDVAGKGFPAALLVAMTRASIRAASRAILSGDPVAVLGRANRDLYDDFSRLGLFATVFLAYFDLATHRLVTANAGHSPVIYRPAGGRARLVRAKAPPIGVLTDWDSERCVLRMVAGDVLVAATDGFSEASDSRTGELFGHDRLLELTDRTADGRASEIAAAFFAATDRFRSAADADDDRTLLVVRGTAPAGTR